MNVYRNYLQHHGILGQKWGIRRYQNEDGTLTAAGKKRYSKEIDKLLENANKRSMDTQVDRLAEAHNEIAEKYNKRGGIDEDSYQRELVDRYNFKTLKEIMNDPDTKKAMNLVKQYGEEILSESASQAFKDLADAGNNLVGDTMKKNKSSGMSGVVSRAPRTPQDSIRRHDEMMKGPGNMSQSEWLQRERKRQSKYNI